MVINSQDYLAGRERFWCLIVFGREAYGYAHCSRQLLFNFKKEDLIAELLDRGVYIELDRAGGLYPIQWPAWKMPLLDIEADELAQPSSSLACYGLAAFSARRFPRFLASVRPRPELRATRAPPLPAAQFSRRAVRCGSKSEAEPAS